MQYGPFSLSPHMTDQDAAVWKCIVEKAVKGLVKAIPSRAQLLPYR